MAAGAYGPGAWGRLAAARLEQLSTEWRGVAEYSCRAQAQGFKTDFWNVIWWLVREHRERERERFSFLVVYVRCSRLSPRKHFGWA